MSNLLSQSARLFILNFVHFFISCSTSFPATEADYLSYNLPCTLCLCLHCVSSTWDGLFLFICFPIPSYPLKVCSRVIFYEPFPLHALPPPGLLVPWVSLGSWLVVGSMKSRIT
jgi:hypothetical protein